MKLFVAFTLLAVASAALNLTTPDVDVGTDYYTYYDATLDRNVTVFQAYRINSVLAWGLQGDNAASPGGEIGFITRQYGSTTGFVLQYCVEVLLPQGATEHDLEHGYTGAFAGYECCNGGQCSSCGYSGSGTNTNPNMVGRSYNLDIPQYASVMSKEYGWWYSFNNAGYCSNKDPLGTNGCTYRSSPYVNVVKLQDVNSLPGWYANPTNRKQYQQINNMLVNAFNSSLMSSFTYDNKQNMYHPLAGQFFPDPKQSCRVPCPAGSYSASGLLDTLSSTSGQCALCPVGSYAPATQSTSCISCPSGLTTNQAGSTSLAACFNPSTPICSAGSFNNLTGHAPCTNCSAGYYQDKVGAESCKECPVYTVNNGTGAASVAACVLNPPSAGFVYSYDNSASGTADIAGEIVAADIPGAVGLLQTSNWGFSVMASGKVSMQCVETVDVPFFPNSYQCWGSYCNFATNTANLPINGTSAQWVSPNGYNGVWQTYPAAGECTNAQLPGQGGCTWKASAITLTANMSALMQAGFYSCQAQNPFGYCWQSLTQAQYANSTFVLSHFAKYANLTSSAVSNSTDSVFGPVVLQNGKCVVQCPTGYTFRSAFTAPHCVLTNTSMANYTTAYVLTVTQDQNDAEAVVFDDSSSSSAYFSVVSAAVCVVAVCGVVFALVAHAIKRRRQASNFKMFL